MVLLYWRVWSWGDEKEKEKSVRGPDPLSFIDNLVQASYVKVFCPVLFTCAQPALEALPQEVSGDRGTEHRCQGGAGSWVRTVPHLYIFPIVTGTMFETKNAYVWFSIDGKSK